MAVKRGKSQARRSGGNSGGMPGWAWLILGIVIALVAVLVAPKFLKGGGDDGFIRPSPNPDAQPAVARADDDELPTPAGEQGQAPAAPKATADKDADYDFYTLLPGQEVAMSDAELAASARAEDVRRQQLAAQQAKANPDAADLAPTGQPAPAGTAATTTPTTAPTTTAPAAAAAAATGGTRYILQAGAFGGSGDAEAIKARIALLGLNARVESANAGGKTVYRVRMGPYGTASELADAKQKLANGGLPAMAIKAK